MHMSDYEMKLRIAMSKKGISTFKELAEKVGISASYLSDIMSGARKATDIRRKINDFLEIEGD